MPRQILFVQGAGQAVHDTWDDKLVHSLERELGPACRVLYPRMPDEAQPRYAAWKAALLREFDELENGALLVGHSVGGTMLLHVLAEERLKFSPGALVLVAAPFIGEGGWHSDDISPHTDFAKRLPRDMPVFLYHGVDDDTVPIAHAQLYAKAIPQATLSELPRRDHQLNNDLRDVARAIQTIPRSMRHP
jgi:predicted alpha/beta hydrolase family esterase